VQDPGAIGVAAPSAPPAGRADPVAPGDTDAPEGSEGPAAGALAALPSAGSPVVPPASAGVPSSFTPKPGGRVVVIGDADFASNQLLALGNNQDLFLNTIAWLVDEDAQIGERADEDKANRLVMTTIDWLELVLATVFLIPGASVATAIAVMVRRRFL
jgi:ABC-type uncharacterized transport system involved in gliding motility auxiliary subunit